ncbi:MAG TPA: fused response regulator/phosphatase [Aliidongia sp.]|nr:fused response regulator/phosphatase [Aliidongia sp.]
MKDEQSADTSGRRFERDLGAIRDCRILIVDDDIIYRTHISRILENRGFTNIGTAVGGRDALVQIDRTPPDLVILDIVMPDLDGFQVCAHLRANPAFADLPILVQTGLDRTADRVRVFECGATDLVSKPTNERELIARISIHLENRLLIQGLTSYQRRTQEELSLARTMQQAILPSASQLHRIAECYGVDVAGFVEPCSEIGGDLWGIRAIDQTRFGLYLFDFCGHGVAAALNTFRIQTLIGALWDFAGDPSVFLATLGLRLYELLEPGLFATMFYAAIDSRRKVMDFAAAGASATVVVDDAGGPSRLLDGSGLPLGITDGARYPCRHAALPSGSSLFLVSDALLETRGADGTARGEAGFVALAERSAHETGAAGAIAAIARDFEQCLSGPAEDDLTAVCMRWRSRRRKAPAIC